MTNTVTPEISTVSVSRLHNTGNYEHAKYEVTVVLNGANPESVMQDLERALNDLGAKTMYTEHDRERARRVLEKPASELSQNEISNMTYYHGVLEDAEEQKEKRKAAFLILNKYQRIQKQGN